eukprot:GEMP01001886.1.p1 GENE.GEMP01001886.1~~GEMP01001886.1.p1  ORF type:complete len:1368 (-),score=321.68 GEMP01001886.1:945-5048(-)
MEMNCDVCLKPVNFGLFEVCHGCIFGDIVHPAILIILVSCMVILVIFVAGFLMCQLELVKKRLRYFPKYEPPKVPFSMDKAPRMRDKSRFTDRGMQTAACSDRLVNSRAGGVDVSTEKKLSKSHSESDVVIINQVDRHAAVHSSWVPLDSAFMTAQMKVRHSTFGEGTLYSWKGEGGTNHGDSNFRGSTGFCEVAFGDKMFRLVAVKSCFGLLAADLREAANKRDFEKKYQTMRFYVEKLVESFSIFTTKNLRSYELVQAEIRTKIKVDACADIHELAEKRLEIVYACISDLTHHVSETSPLSPCTFQANETAPDEMCSGRGRVTLPLKSLKSQLKSVAGNNGSANVVDAESPAPSVLAQSKVLSQAEAKRNTLPHQAETGAQASRRRLPAAQNTKVDARIKISVDALIDCLEIDVDSLDIVENVICKGTADAIRANATNGAIFGLHESGGHGRPVETGETSPEDALNMIRSLENAHADVLRCVVDKESGNPPEAVGRARMLDEWRTACAPMCLHLRNFLRDSGNIPILMTKVLRSFYHAEKVQIEWVTGMTQATLETLYHETDIALNDITDTKATIEKTENHARRCQIKDSTRSASASRLKTRQLISASQAFHGSSQSAASSTAVNAPTRENEMIKHGASEGGAEPEVGAATGGKVTAPLDNDINALHLLRAQLIIHKEKLYQCRSKMLKLQSELWVIQIRFLPEIVADLQMLFQESFIVSQFVSLSAEESRLLQSIVVPRQRCEYDDEIQLAGKSKYRNGSKSSDLLGLYDMTKSSYIETECSLKAYSLGSIEEAELFVKELQLSAKLAGHPLIACAQAAFVDQGCGYIQYPRYDGNLLWYLNHRTSSLASLLQVIRDLIDSVRWIHQQGVTHGRLEPRSWLAGERLQLGFFRHATLDREQEAKTFKPSCTVLRPGLTTSVIANTNSSAPSDDCFALGATIEVVFDQWLEPGCPVAEMLTNLAAELSHPDALERASALDASYSLDRIHEHLRSQADANEQEKRRLASITGRLHAEQARAVLSTQKIREESERLRLEVEEREDEGKQLEERVIKYKAQLEVYQQRVQMNRKFDLLSPPSYWEQQSLEAPWQVFPVFPDTPTWRALSNMLVVENPYNLGKGRDVQEKGKAYSSLWMVGAWRVENPVVWRKYSVERQNTEYLLRENNLQVQDPKIRSQMADSTAGLEAELDSSFNEVYLLHGTSPSSVLPILSEGVNERFTSVALFGRGTYFAEDAAKCDQYVVGYDGSTPDLQRLLFDGPFFHPGEKVYFFFVCRVSLGYFVRCRCTRTVTNGVAYKNIVNLDAPDEAVFSPNTDERELSYIPGVHPPLLYQSLIAEKGGALFRFREFVTFHSARIYPEYVITYVRR